MTSQIVTPREFQIKECRELNTRSAAQQKDLIETYQYKTLWTYIANCILGLWLITSPVLFDYRSSQLATSDSISGALLILFEALAFSPSRTFMRWCTCAVAFWLLFAPLIFWSPTAAVYLNDTLVACFVMVFAILIPGTPGKGGAELPGPDRPPGWTYNPSSWIRRWLGIALALVGFFISRYLAAHQLGYTPHAWDPFFGDGSDKVTSSSISKAFPISDAGFGSVAYMMETLAGFMGDRARWRTAPWVAVTFAILVLPLGATSLLLVIMQPVVVGYWCGLCLISAVCLLASVPLAVHEAVAVGQFLLDSKKRRKNLWSIFWLGGSITGSGTNDPDRKHFSFAQRWIESVRGVTVPCAIATQIAIGAWLLARPDIFPSAKISADCDHIMGALVLTIAAVASAEVTRIARYFNTLFGAMLIVAAFIFAGPSPLIFFSDLLSGVCIIIASLPCGSIAERYAGWDKFVK